VVLWYIAFMRAVLFHAKEYGVKITGLATRPADVVPEDVTHETQHVENAVVAFVTIEKGDTEKEAKRLVTSIQKMAKEVGEKNVVVAPFAHLSNNLADSHTGRKLFDQICASLGANTALHLERMHFGSDKELLLHLYGHPGNARYREFYPE
jgi:threonyl-tRNA synthetase